jgi:hypothetical protein
MAARAALAARTCASLDDAKHQPSGKAPKLTSAEVDTVSGLRMPLVRAYCGLAMSVILLQGRSATSFRVAGRTPAALTVPPVAAL